MPTDFMTLVIIVAVVLIILKLLKATAKLMITAAIIAAVVWALITYVPELSAAVPLVTSWATV